MLRAIDRGLRRDDNRASACVQFDYSLSRRCDDIHDLRWGGDALASALSEAAKTFERKASRPINLQCLQIRSQPNAGDGLKYGLDALASRNRRAPLKRQKEEKAGGTSSQEPVLRRLPKADRSRNW